MWCWEPHMQRAAWTSTSCAPWFTHPHSKYGLQPYGENPQACGKPPHFPRWGVSPHRSVKVDCWMDTQPSQYASTCPTGCRWSLKHKQHRYMALGMGSHPKATCERVGNHSLEHLPDAWKMGAAHWGNWMTMHPDTLHAWASVATASSWCFFLNWSFLNQ